MVKFLLCLIGASALAQIPPVPALRPGLAPTNSVRTNIYGDVIITTVIRADRKRHYYGAITGGNGMSYIGELSESAFETWAYTGKPDLGNQPEISRWYCIFSTTNFVAPTLNHVRMCPP